MNKVTGTFGKWNRMELSMNTDGTYRMALHGNEGGSWVAEYASITEEAAVEKIQTNYSKSEYNANGMKKLFSKLAAELAVVVEVEEVTNADYDLPENDQLAFDFDAEEAAEATAAIQAVEDEAAALMTRYTYKVTPQGTRMDDTPLYGLVITDSTPVLTMFARTVYDELTGEELNFYLNAIEKENAL